MLYKKHAHLADKITTPEKSSIKSIIFDMEGVLFSISRIKQIKLVLLIAIKYPSLIYVLLTKNIRHEFLKMLEQIPTQKQDQTIFNKNQKVPSILVDWMTGKDSKHLLNATVSHILTCNYSAGQKALFCSIAESLFIPENFMTAARPIKKMHTLAYALKNKGYNLYILSNWDAQSFLLLTHKYQPFFNIFSGYLISGTEGISKPNSEFYEKLLTRYDLNPAETIFIDDEQQNIKAASNLKIHSILQNSFSSLCKQLKQIGVMK